MENTQNTTSHAHTYVHPKHIALIEIGSTEKILCTIKKHPIGLVPVYLTGGFISALTLLVGILGGTYAMRKFGLGTSMAYVFIGAFALVSVATLFFTYVAGFIYNNNIIILTNEKIARIVYRSLIDRKITQLALGELEDVSVEQRGIYARIFGFGTLQIETAAEQGSFDFPLAPFPYECSKSIVEAHEDIIKKYGN
jgi:uncharacterized membrane protein YdbT with pleckstrin-like domain